MEKQNMICVLMVAAHSVRLEREIASSEHERAYIGTPKALLPSGDGTGKVILDTWWEEIKKQHTFQRVFLVCNANKFKYFQRWASANDFPLDNIVNDGTTSEEHSLGALADLELVLRSKHVNKDHHVVVIAADMAFYDNFDFSVVLQYFERVSKHNVAVYYDLAPGDSCDRRGMITIDETTKRVTKFVEKPKDWNLGRMASVVFYCFRAEDVHLLTEFAAGQTDHPCSLGTFMQWFVERAPTYALKLPTSFQLIGSGVGIEEYRAYLSHKSVPRTHASDRGGITHKAHARVGICGNPSDGYNGKTISMTIENFWCEVTIVGSEKLRLVPHPLNDPNEFGSLSDLYGISVKEGYLGGLRLLQATCKKFFEYCLNNGIALSKKNFTLSYDTNIPRQVGLAGSSGIVTATMRCLMDFFGITYAEISKEKLPNLILSVEQEELFITAGLQDRVVQVYEGLVFMDFSKDLLDSRGHGHYEYIDCAKDIVSKFFLVWAPDPSDSGKIHSDVRERYKRGDVEVLDAMKEFAQYAEDAKAAVLANNIDALCTAMDNNFNLRRRIFGDRCLGSKNLQMIEIGRKHGAATKFPGSGGAILGLCRTGSNVQALRHDYEEQGYVFVQLHFHNHK